MCPIKRKPLYNTVYRYQNANDLSAPKKEPIDTKNGKRWDKLKGAAGFPTSMLIGWCIYMFFFGLRVECEKLELCSVGTR